MDEKVVTMAMLFDFFGELLTDKQRDCFDLYYNDDLSLSEIAEYRGISRQAVRDNIVRAEAALCELEEKTGIVERFESMNKLISELEKDVQLIIDASDGDSVLCRTAEDMKLKLKRLKG